MAKKRYPKHFNEGRNWRPTPSIPNSSVGNLSDGNNQGLWDAKKKQAKKRRTRLCSDVKVYNKDRLKEKPGSDSEEGLLHTESKWKTVSAKCKGKRKRG